MKRATQSVWAFYSQHSRSMVALVALIWVAGAACFLRVDQQAGAVVFVTGAFLLLGFLPENPQPYDGAGGVDPLGQIGSSQADIGSGPFLMSMADRNAARRDHTTSRFLIVTSRQGWGPSQGEAPFRC